MPLPVPATMLFNHAGSVDNENQSYPVLGRGVVLELQCINIAVIPLPQTIWYYFPEELCTGPAEQLPNGDNRFEILQGGPVPDDFLRISDIGREVPSFCVSCCQVDLSVGGGTTLCPDFPVRAVGKEQSTMEIDVLV